jgi:hypothetical protein
MMQAAAISSLSWPKSTGHTGLKTTVPDIFFFANTPLRKKCAGIMA